MKIIFSTLAMQTKIQEAIDNNTTTFEVDSGARSHILFMGDSDVRAHIEATVNDKSQNYKGVFNVNQWKKILNFLKQLEEQPAVFEFQHYAHTDIHEVSDITLEQIVITF